MADAYVLRVTEGLGSPQYYVVSASTYNAATAADDGEEGFMEWFNEAYDETWVSFWSVKDLTDHLAAKGLELKGELEGFLY